MYSSQINIIPSHQINKQKWDACVELSANGTIYAQSYYLDQLADNWDGIVVNDYECVMPVPWRKKFGIRYCYDVPFIQQLGYFNSVDVDHKGLVDAFFIFIKYGHYNFNYSNNIIADLPGVKKAANFIINLTDKESILKNFTKSFKQSLQNASANDLSYVATTAPEAIQMYKDLYGATLQNVSEDDYKKLTALTEILSSQNKCVARKIIDTNEQTLSIVLLLMDNRRLYNIINATNSEGRRTQANYFLYAQLLNEFAGKGLLFDLEGSELPGVKSFYKKMGAVNQPYYRMKINNLPFPGKLLKH
jgi:hypothetical protein